MRSRRRCLDFIVGSGGGGGVWKAAVGGEVDEGWDEAADKGWAQCHEVAVDAEKQARFGGATDGL